MIHFSSTGFQKNELIKDIVRLVFDNNIKKSDRIPLKLLFAPSDKRHVEIKFDSPEGEWILNDFFTGIYSFFLLYWPYERNQDALLKERDKYSGSSFVFHNCPSNEPICYRCISDIPFNKDNGLKSSLKFIEKSTKRPKIRFLGYLESLFSWDCYQSLPPEFEYTFKEKNSRIFFHQLRILLVVRQEKRALPSSVRKR